jgi:hypothetical protein
MEKCQPITLYPRVSQKYLQSFFKLFILLAALSVAHTCVSIVCFRYCDSGSNMSDQLLVCCMTVNMAKSNFHIHQRAACCDPFFVG